MRDLREYRRPQTLREAIQLLSDENLRAVPMAGGTWLLADSAARAGTAVDLQDLPLKYVKYDKTGLRLGALTRLATLCEAPDVCGFAGGALAGAARDSCSSLLRNQSTLGGALLRPAANGELAAVFLVLEAEVLIERAEGSSRSLLADLCQNPDTRISGALMTEIHIPIPGAGACVCRRRIARTPGGRALLAAVALTRVVGGSIAECRVAIAGAGVNPRRLPQLEAELVNASADREAMCDAVMKCVGAAHEMPDHLQASAEYRRAVLPTLIRRALLDGLTEP